MCDIISIDEEGGRERERGKKEKISRNKNRSSPTTPFESKMEGQAIPINIYLIGVHPSCSWTGDKLNYDKRWPGIDVYSKELGR